MPEFTPYDMTLAGPAAVIEGFLRSHRAAAYADLTQPAPFLAPVLAVIGPIPGNEANQSVLRIGVRASEPIAVPEGAWLSDGHIGMLALGTWCSLPPAVPAAVTNFQARAVLMQMGLFDAVNAALQAQGGMSWQAWEQANEFTRNGALLNQMAEQFGLTPAALDALFIAAAQIEA